ncbi:type I-E CRISPR-associated protein Cse1/CasA [Olsenella sp. SW781]|uniref:type I-E CRISPR-associated protein Cse1/CasA n=1 Tax=Olsenella sp. SW781 TaxID=2530046 RepID=UPI00143C1A23|nr:type I-E CRISPR-associated protein Cse1/CasA [Olsenella sp. SW781]NJE81199.1 type I-E CRISPR-associated protein Cse1/CasA [Olsenella sp. SW781]
MIKQNPHYDLRFEPWIPVERLDGTADVVSIRDALAGAHQIRRLSGEIPGEGLALLRLLLALVYCINYEFEELGEKQKKERWEELRSQGCFGSDQIDEYLADYPHEFDLFDDEHPFYQIPGLDYMGEKEFDSVSELMLDVPKPEKFLFSMRSPAHLDSLPFDLAARYLVVVQAYHTAGIKSPVVGNTSAKSGKAYAPKGALGTGWCGALGGIYLEGQNLFETLLLNFVLFLSNVSVIVSDDYAPWEREVPSADTCQREPTGPVDLLTWQSRRIRLIPSEDGSCVRGVIISYGDVLIPANKQRFEMMTGWRESKQQQKKLGTATVPLMPVAPDTARALWRGLPSLLALADGGKLRPGVIRWMSELQDAQSPEDWRLNVRIVCQGVSYGTQSSVVDDAITDSVDLRATLLRKDSEAVVKMLDVIERTDQAVGVLVRFVQNVERAQGDKRRYDSFSDSAAQASREDVREGAYDALDALYRARIAEFPDEGVDEYCLAWRKEAQFVLRRLANAYVSYRHVSCFSEHDDVSVGQALAWFEGGLVKALF